MTNAGLADSGRADAGQADAGRAGAGRAGDGPTGAGRAGRSIALATELAPLGLVVVAEAAWISVLGGLLQEFALRDPVIGLPALAALVVLGIVLARVAGPRLGSRWPLVAFVVVVAGGTSGWLSAPAARDALAQGPGAAFAENPGGWIAGLAILRGFAHARLPMAEGTITNLLAIGVPGLAFAATMGGLIGDPYRTRFLADALVAAIVYVGATVLALAFARLDAIGIDAGFDWRRNPPWLLMATAVLALAILVAVPLASVAGTVLSVVLSVSLGPLLIVGLATGFDRAARRLLLFFAGAVILVIVLSRIFGNAGIVPEQQATGVVGEAPSSPAEQILSIGIGGLLLLGLIVAILVLIAMWMRRTPIPDGLVGETRTIDASGAGLLPRRRRNRFGRRAEPRTAVEAYVALVDDLERHPAVRREPAETPAAHAARLRGGGQPTLALDLLAADYALARYGGVTLGARENRRAVGRWRLLRRALLIGPDGRRLGGSAGHVTRTDVELPVDLEPRRTF